MLAAFQSQMPLKDIQQSCLPRLEHRHGPLILLQHLGGQREGTRAALAAVRVLLAGEIVVAGRAVLLAVQQRKIRSAEHTSELQSLMSISYAVVCLIKKNNEKKVQQL